ncbi:MAG: hypothetical protein ACR2FM_01190 [Candidatus Saccharimonadales bacterium]
MLEFIVLGQIPGTEVYLSFSTIGLIILGLFGSAVTVRALNWASKHLHVKHKQNNIKSQTI